MIEKTMETATELISTCVQRVHAETLLSPVECRFLNLPFDRTELSLTDKQDTIHQLRFYEESFGTMTTNQIAIKISGLLKDKGEKIEVNSFGSSSLEKLFLERLSIYAPTHLSTICRPSKINKLPVEYTKMRYFQNIGDTWSAKLIGDRLMDNDKYADDPIFLKLMSFNYSGLSDPFAAKAIIEKVISMGTKTASEYNNLVSAQYLLALLYSRHLPKKFKDFDKSKSLLNEAYSVCIDKNIPMENREFEKVFNRNGYALLLFYDGKYNETINMMKGLIELGPNDTEYKYVLVRFYIGNKRFNDALEVLNEIEKKGAEDIIYQESYKAQCLMELNEADKAMNLAKNAVIQNIELDAKNMFLYNYVVCALNAGRNIEKEFVDTYIETGSMFERDILSLL